MNEIELYAPVKKPEDIETFAKSTSCRKFYVYHKKRTNVFHIFPITLL